MRNSLKMVSAVAIWSSVRVRKSKTGRESIAPTVMLALLDCWRLECHHQGARREYKLPTRILGHAGFLDGSIDTVTSTHSLNQLKHPILAVRANHYLLDQV